MNREIKFRAWDGEKMSDTIQLEFAHGLRLVSTSDLGFGMIGDDKCILMQFIGLKDKNGKEIYEGDVVMNAYEEFTGDVTFFKEVITFTGGCFCFESYSHAHVISDKEGLNLEIIGNIYQNPNLIK